ncbi:MAG: hypothetical protein AD073_000277 [Mycoplasmataceae bacterium]|nr:MAG: hypothetical protein AD073_000277 [Mycoplasmataceae bacterium]
MKILAFTRMQDEKNPLNQVNTFAIKLYKNTDKSQNNYN